MDKKVLHTLEFDKILQLLSERAAFSVGKSRALELLPTASLRQAQRWQEETAQAKAVIEEHGPPPFGGLRDVRDDVGRTLVGAVLYPDQLLAIADTVRGCERLRDFLLERAPQVQAEIVEDLAGMIGKFRDIEREITRCIDTEGRVVDGASPKLAEIRRALRTHRQRVRDYLDGLVRSSSAQKHLQEPIVTLRNGRYVVPVKQEHRGEIPGIVHDHSTSGATIFVEPMPVVELNNQIRRLEVDEEKEVERILSDLSLQVAQRADEMIHSIEAAAELDFVFAKGRLALDWEATRPQLNSDGKVKILQGRHPLLEGEVVPIDVEVGEGFVALVITGPNTGGKTVTLKTVGLFSLMAQAGLHLPAEEGTVAAVFEQVFADIGDEQSIEQSLSTFSSHMTNIVAMMHKVDDRSLVLLDELGAGTDPVEGAALAKAILEDLIDQDCRIIATTHYSELKHFAYTHPGALNASVEFDVETLRPTYRLSIGLAGKSHAFAIASRLGLDRRIIERARAQLTEEERKVDDLLGTIEADRHSARRDRESAEQLKKRYEELHDKYHRAFERLKRDREAVLNEARREAQQMISSAKRETDEILGQLRKLQRDPGERSVTEARKRLEALHGSLNGGATLSSAPEKERKGASAWQKNGPELGQSVRIESLGQQGEVVQLMGDGKVAVQVGTMRVTVDQDDLSPIRGARHGGVTSTTDRGSFAGNAPEIGRSVAASVGWEKAKSIPVEIDLRGQRVDEALEEIDKYLDDAVLAGVERVRLIHGKGTGALREAVQRFVEEDARVRAYRLGEQSEGGSGVTVVEF